MKKKLKLLWQLFCAFFRIGAFTFGGGYAMIPIIQRDIAEKKGWISDDDLLDIIAIAESTPGPIAINAATFVGFKTAGVSGAAAATFGTVLPSFIIISVIAFLLNEFQSIKAVQYAFFGIRAGVLALVLKALYTMYKKFPKSKTGYFIATFAFIAAAILDINMLLIIICCAAIGLVTSLYFGRRSGL